MPPEQARRAADRGIRLSASKPDGLLAMVFIPGRAPAEDAGVRQAIAQTVDRASLVNFILQKEGEPTDSLLPQWSSGTAFLFPVAADPARAKELWHQIAPSPKFVLGYDAGDPLEASVAERIAVTAREVGIPLATRAIPDALTTGGSQAGQSESGAQAVDARLVRWRMASPDPREALLGFEHELMNVGYPDPGPLPERASAEEIFEREQSMLTGFCIVPIVWLPHVYGLSARMRDWTAPEPGSGWPLVDVWLESEAN